MPAVFLAVYVWFILQVYQSSPLESRTGLAFIALGLPVYLAYRYGTRHRAPSRS